MYVFQNRLPEVNFGHYVGKFSYEDVIGRSASDWPDSHEPTHEDSGVTSQSGLERDDCEFHQSLSYQSMIISDGVSGHARS